jgi:hypothetical protein
MIAVKKIKCRKDKTGAKGLANKLKFSEEKDLSIRAVSSKSQKWEEVL